MLPFLLDGIVVVLSGFAALWVRIGGALNFTQWVYEISLVSGPQTISWTHYLSWIVAFSAVTLALLWIPRRRHSPTYGSLAAIQRCAIVVSGSTAICIVLFVCFRPPNFPLSLVPIAGAFAFAGFAFLRFVHLVERTRRSQTRLQAELASTPALVNGILIVLALVISAGLIEGMLRIHNPFGFRLRGEQLVLPANRYIHIHNASPGKLEADIIHRKNSLGFRGPEPPADVTDRLSLVTVGGSTTEEIYLSDDRTWTAVMARELAPRFHKLWVNNAGLIGHSTYAHRVLLQDILSRLKPRVVIFLIGINDMGRDQLDTAYHVRFDTQFERERDQIRSFLDVLADHSELASVLYNLSRYYAAVTLGYAQFRVDFSGYNTIDFPPARRADPTKETQVLETASVRLSGYLSRVRSLITLARSFGAEPVLVTQPLLWGEAVDPATGTDLGTLAEDIHGIQTTSATFWRVLEAYNDVLRQVAVEERLLLVDLANGLPKDSQFFFDKMHFSLDGAAAVGHHIAAGICPHIKMRFGEFSADQPCPEAASRAAGSGQPATEAPAARR